MRLELNPDQQYLLDVISTVIDVIEGNQLGSNDCALISSSRETPYLLLSNSQRHRISTKLKKL